MVTSRSNQHDTDIFLMKALTLHHSVSEKEEGMCARVCVPVILVREQERPVPSEEGMDGLHCSNLHLRPEFHEEAAVLYLQTAFPTRTNILKGSITSQY